MIFPKFKIRSSREIVSEYFKSINYMYFSNLVKTCNETNFNLLTTGLVKSAARLKKYNIIHDLDNIGIVFIVYNFRGDMAVYDVNKGNTILIKEKDKELPYIYNELNSNQGGCYAICNK